MKRKEKKAILLKLHQEVKLLPAFVGDVNDYPFGFCGLIASICTDRILFDIIYKYVPHIPPTAGVYAYWFEPGDWKIRLSFLEEVMKVELNPFYKLMYKFRLYKFKY